MHVVVETPEFLARAKDVDLSDEERDAIIDFLARNPTAGEEIPGAGGARKIRFAGRSKGKSGGYRVFTFYSGIDIPVFIISVLAKNVRVDLTQRERNGLRQVLGEIASAYREGRPFRV